MSNSEMIYLQEGAPASRAKARRRLRPSKRKTGKAFAWSSTARLSPRLGSILLSRRTCQALPRRCRTVLPQAQPELRGSFILTAMQSLESLAGSTSTIAGLISCHLKKSNKCTHTMPIASASLRVSHEPSQISKRPVASRCS